MPRGANASAEPKTSARPGATMTAEHKAALATGRDEGRTIRRYLEALEANRPRKGRKRTRESVEKQLNETLDRLTKASALDRVQLLQRRLDLEQELEGMALGGADRHGRAGSRVRRRRKAVLRTQGTHVRSMAGSRRRSSRAQASRH